LGSCLIENLLPRNYDVKIAKNGFYPWKKTLEIKEKQVTEIKNIVLFKQNLEISQLENNVDDYWLSPDGKKIAILQTGSMGFELSLYDHEKRVKSKLLQQKDLKETNPSLKSLEWSSDSRSITLVILENARENYYTLNIETTPIKIAGINKPALPKNEAPEGSLAYLKNSMAYYYISDSGTVFKKDLLAAVPSKISDKPLPADGKEIPHKLWLGGDYLFAKAGLELFVHNRGQEKFEKIFDGLTSDVLTSPDGKKAAYNSDSEIWVFFLKERADQPQKNAGDRIFIARLSKKIQNLAWLNSDYLVFLSGGAVKTAEIDDRGSTNITDIAVIEKKAENSNKEPMIQWDLNSKNLFLFDGSTLSKTQPLPD
jgi:hypothetical protein